MAPSPPGRPRPRHRPRPRCTSQRPHRPPPERLPRAASVRGPFSFLLVQKLEHAYVSPMQAIYALVLATLTAIHPGAPRRNVTEIGRAIATTIDRDCKGDGALGSCALDAVTLAVTAEEEGGLCLGRECGRGDHGRSSSTFGVMGWSDEEIDLYERDLRAASRRAYVVLRASAKTCVEPLAVYV